MAVKEVKFPVIYIKHKGNFSLSKLLQDIKSWFDNNHYEFHAPKHKHKAESEDIKFFGERKITGYIKFYLTVEIRVWELREVEVIKDGEKVKTNHGRVAIDFIPSYKLDYDDRFGGSKWMQAIQDFYHKYIIKRKIEDYWEDELFLQAGNLIRVIKNALEYEAM
jgi:hypothetical protein